MTRRAAGVVLGAASLLGVACGPGNTLAQQTADAGWVADERSRDDAPAAPVDATPIEVHADATSVDAAPLEVAPPVEVGSAISGACVLHDSLTPIPAASHDNDGTGFRKLVIPGVNDIATLQQRCTLDVYRALQPIYCLSGGTEAVTYEVVTYNADGSPKATACASGGCGPYSCGKIGSCTIRDGSLPAWDAPDVGPGYARKVIPGAADWEALRAGCTPGIYDELLRAYCAMNRPDVGPLQLEISLYNPDLGIGGGNTWVATSCHSMECKLVQCP